MPTYENACHACGNDFEALARSDTVPECPGAHSPQLQQRLSVFARSAGAAERVPTMAGPRGGCDHAVEPGSYGLH